MYLFVPQGGQLNALYDTLVEKYFLTFRITRTGKWLWTKSSILSDVQISFRRLTKVDVTRKLWLKSTDVKRHCRKVGHLSMT